MTASCIEDIITAMKEEIQSFIEITGTEGEDIKCIEQFARSYLSILSNRELLRIHEKETYGFASSLRKIIEKSISRHLLESSGIYIYNFEKYEAYMCNYTLTNLIKIITGENTDNLQKIKNGLCSRFGRNCAVMMHRNPRKRPS